MGTYDDILNVGKPAARKPVGTYDDILSVGSPQPNTSYASKEEFLNDRAAPQPAAPDTRSTLRKYLIEPVLAPAEMAATMGSGMVGTLAGNLIGAVSGKGAPLAQKIAGDMTYQPRTQPAREGLELLGDAFTASKLPPMPGITGLPSGAITNAVKPGLSLLNSANQARIAAKAEALANQSRQAAPMLDAFYKARENGIAVDPARVDPTFYNKTRRIVIGGQHTGVATSNANEGVWANILKDELNIPKTVPLTNKTNALKLGRQRNAGQVYEEVTKVPKMDADTQLIRDIEGASSYEGNSPNVVALLKRDMPTLVSEVKNKLSDGMNGKDALDLTKKYRREANNVYKQLNPSSEDIALADAKKTISNAIESFVERKLTDMDKTTPGMGYGDLSDRFKKAREYVAKSHVVENATDLNTGITNPAKIAQLTAKENGLTGKLADIGEIAGNFPESAQVRATLGESTHPHIARSGVGGSIGYTLGGGHGAVIGAGTSRIMEAIASKLIASPKTQSKINPKDFRPLREQLGYPQFAPTPKPELMTNPTRAEFQAHADAIRRAEIDAILQAGAASRANPQANPLAMQAAAQRAEIDAILQAGAASRARNRRK